MLLLSLSGVRGWSCGVTSATRAERLHAKQRRLLLLALQAGVPTPRRHRPRQGSDKHVHRREIIGLAAVVILVGLGQIQVLQGRRRHRDVGNHLAEIAVLTLQLSHA